ncbi:MAG: serine--tRNA ligase [bacterium]|nr:serine--tRNA ligase [bacterium]
MLDLKFILKNMEDVRKNCENRNIKVDLDELARIAGERSALTEEVENIRMQQNQTAKKMKGKLTPEERQELIKEGSELKAKAAEKDEVLKKLNADLKELQSKIPNMTHPEAPVGKGEESNRDEYFFMEPTKFDFEPKDHVELGKSLGILDFDGGAKVTGQKFYFLKGDGVLLEQALINFALRTLIEKGFVPHITPDLAKNSVLFGTGFNPRGSEAQIYSIENSDMSLIATAEITLAGLYSGEIIPERDLPLKIAGYSHCFRTEAGAYGKSSKGLYRVHQFSKVEMFAYTKPEQSDEMLQELLGIEKEIFAKLKVPYRVIECCTGDLGGPAYRKYDIEAWMPGREGGSYGEVTSTSNCTDYQARRLNIKYKDDKTKKTELVHTLNGTAIAVSRGIIAVLENYQQKDGSVIVPEVLRPYMGKDIITPVKK